MITRLRKPSPTTVRAKVLRDLLRHSAPSQDPTRPHLCTLRFEGGQVLSTDGHRMHQLPAPASLAELEATVTTWAIEAALSATDDSRNIEFSLSDNDVVLAFSTGYVTATRPQFPPWRLVHPLESRQFGAPKLEVELPLSTTLREVRRLRKGGTAVLLSGASYAHADSDQVKHYLRITASDVNHAGRPEPDAAFTDLPGVEWTGKVGLRADYLIDALATAKWSLGGTKGHNVILRAWGELDPVLVSWENGDVVIMPVRL